MATNIKISEKWCCIMWIITSDGNKTKMLRPRPRPTKQLQDYITKNVLLQHAFLLSKITWCSKRQKVIWWPPTFGTVSALIAGKNTGVYYYISALSCHTAPVGHNSVGSKNKSIRPRLRPRPKLQDQDQDRGRSETNLAIRPWSQTPRLIITKFSGSTPVHRPLCS